MSKHLRISATVLAIGLALALPSAQAQTFTWTQSIGANTTVNWVDGSWAPSAPTSGADQIAAFNITGTTGGLTINNTPSIILGTIRQEATNTRAITINNGTITLAVTSGAPSIENVSNLTIGSTLAGTQGFVKTGGGRLQLNGNNSGLSGAVSLNAGTTVAGNNGAFGTGTVTMNGGGLNGGISAGTRTLANDFVWNSGTIQLDTTNGTGSSGAAIQFDGTMTLNGASGNLIQSSPNADLTQNFIFANTVSGGTSGNTLGIQTNSFNANVFSTFRTANTFAHNITLNQGGTTPLGGRTGSMGFAVGNDTALSSANVTVGAHRFVIASEDSNARVLANNFVFTTNNAGSGNAPLYQFTLGQSTLATTPGVSTFGGTGNIAIGNLDIAAATGVVAPIARRINVEGSTVGTINGVFSRSGTLAAANMTIEKVGTGTLVLANSSNTYNGAFTVAAGTLLVNGNLNGTTLTVNTGATLGGSGSIGAATTSIAGNHNPGNSPGLQTFTGASNLAYTSTADFNFELIANTTAGRGVNYDGVNLEDGSLSIASGADFNITLNGSGSTVNFGDAFWATDKAWIVFDLDSDNLGGAGSVTGMFNLGAVSLDSLGNNYASYGSFGLSTVSGDVVLSWTAIPEPSTYALLAGGLAVLVFLRRRKVS